ncbi:MAG: hypothetical protein ACRCX2_01075 [Paraclostridium sp.]
MMYEKEITLDCGTYHIKPIGLYSWYIIHGDHVMVVKHEVIETIQFYDTILLDNLLYHVIKILSGFKPGHFLDEIFKYLNESKDDTYFHWEKLIKIKICRKDYLEKNNWWWSTWNLE